MYDDNLWEGVLSSLAKVIDTKLIDTWLRPARISAKTDNVMLQVPNKFFKNWIEKRYLSNINSVLREEFGIESGVCVEVGSVSPSVNFTETKRTEPVQHNDNISYLDSKLTFENFVHGESNGFAHSAALAVAEGNFSIYNPLYIYGGTGLGKTHLVYAIANKVRLKFPKMKILYMDSESFSQEIINLFRKGERQEMQSRIENMKERFRAVDVFILDDIQFMKTREKSLEFFFNIFNDFQTRQKQVVITSDESPQEIDMAERMRSRFASGFQAEIQPPNIEERVAILLQKSEELSLPIDEHVALFLAENASAKNVRELIGALKRVCIVASFHNKKVDVSTAEKALSDSGMLKKKNVIVNPQHLITVVSEIYNVKLSDLVSKKRTHSIVFPRQVAMYLLREKLTLSLKEIGSYFGGRDHSTVKYAIETIKRQLDGDDFLQGILKNIVDRTFN